MENYRKPPVLLKVNFETYDLESLSLNEYRQMGIKPPTVTRYGYIRIDQILSVQPSSERPGCCVVESTGNTSLLVNIPIERFDELLAAHARVIDYTCPDNIPFD